MGIQSSNISNILKLINNTGGALISPGYNAVTRKSYIVVLDPTNFSCEEDAQYTYRQEANYEKYPGEGRSCTIHLIILKYRELGLAKFSINITVFNQTLDDFITVQIPVSIPRIPLTTKNRKNNFPDGRIHTIKIAPPNGVIQGERPQASITYAANSGPISITKLVLCGNADELAQQ